MRTLAVLVVMGALIPASAGGREAQRQAVIDLTIVDVKKRPVRGAVCRLDGKFRPRRTNARGQVQLITSQLGKRTLTCTARRFVAVSRKLTLTGGRNRTIITMKRAPRAAKPKREAKVSYGFGAMGGSGGGYGGGGSATGRGYGLGAAPPIMRRSASAPRVRVAMAGRAAPRGAVIRRAVMPLEPQHGNREGYDPIAEKGFVKATEQPLSTVSIDVDTAAYSNVRRFANQSRLPPKDAVRIEELLNYFEYAYPGPKDDRPFAVHVEASTAPWNPRHRLVRVGLQGKRVQTDKLPPTNLVFLVDVSGSMHSYDKLPLLKAAFSLLVGQLRPQDRVSIVVYAGAAGLVLPPTAGSQKAQILDAIERLQAGGSTAGGAGIRLAYQVARDTFMERGNNRVILATDGDFNVGQSSDAELVRMIEKERDRGVFLTVLGFGTGNYQDAKMQKLADHGNGHHAYIDNLLEAQKVLVRQMGATLLTIAKDVKVQIEMNPTKIKAWRLIGYENRVLAAQDFANDKKDAGELGAGHSVTFLYELVPADSEEVVHGHAKLRYQQKVPTRAASSAELLTVKLRYKAPRGTKSKLIVHPLLDRHVPFAGSSADFRFAAAVAELGLVLRESKHRGTANLARAIAHAEGALGADKHGDRRDFVHLARKIALLWKARPRS